MRALPAAVLGSLAIAAPAAAVPVIHAHRGGALDFGKPVRPEDAMPAFAHVAGIAGTWLELDTVVSADGVPVVIHDSTLDRTTDCTGNVLDTPVAQIEACRIDKLGVSETLVDAPPVPPLRIPRLTEVLSFARERGLGVNLEIKRIPGDPGYVPGDEAFAMRVMEIVRAARLNPDRLIIQSFDPTNLDVAARALPGVQLSFLTLAEVNEGAPEFASARGYQWVSPGGVPSASYVQRAKSYGLKVVPYTLDTPGEVTAAAALGVEAIITDDVPMARQALGLPDPPPTPVAKPRVKVTFPRQSLRTVLRRRALVVRASGRANVTVRLRKLVVARGTLMAGTSRLRLSARGRRALRASRRSVRLTVAFDGRRRTLSLR